MECQKKDEGRREVYHKVRETEVDHMVGEEAKEPRETRLPLL